MRLEIEFNLIKFIVVSFKSNHLFPCILITSRTIIWGLSLALACTQNSLDTLRIHFVNYSICIQSNLAVWTIIIAGPILRIKRRSLPCWISNSIFIRLIEVWSWIVSTVRALIHSSLDCYFACVLLLFIQCYFRLYLWCTGWFYSQFGLYTNI